MNKFKLKQGTSLVLLLVGYVIVELLFFRRLIGVDEPWYSNVAYNFVQGNGLVDTIARDGSPWPTFLYPLILGSFFKLFGTSVFVGRLVSLLGGLVALSGFVQIQRLWKIKPIIILTTGSLFIVSNMYQIIFCNIRPEAWCVAFAIWAFFFLARGVERNRSADFMLSALFVSCAMLCHLNAALYAVLFGVFALGFSWTRKDFLPVVGFGSVGLLCAVGWMLYYTIGCGESIATFLADAAGKRTVAGSDSLLAAFVQAFPEFVRAYSTGLKRLYIFIFEVGVLVVGLFFVRRNRRLFFIALGGLIYFLLALFLLKPLSTIHFGEVLFFSLLATGLILKQLEGQKTQLICFCVIVGLYGANGALGSAGRIFKYQKNISPDKVAAQIEQHVPKGAKVLSLMPFWFGLKDTEFYSSYTRWEQKGHEGLDDFLKNGNPEYVVYSSYILERLNDQPAENTGGENAATHLQKLIQKGSNRQRTYCEKVSALAVAKGVAVFEVNTRGYGKIVVWKLGTLSSEPSRAPLR